jgi:hypothetical protein
MAKVWFARRQNRLVALGRKPLYEGDLEALIWPLDIGLHRYYTDKPLVIEDEPLPHAFSPNDMVLVEVSSRRRGGRNNYQVDSFFSVLAKKRE